MDFRLFLYKVPVFLHFSLRLRILPCFLPADYFPRTPVILFFLVSRNMKLYLFRPGIIDWED